MDSNGELIPEEQQEYKWLEEALTESSGSISLKQLIPEVGIPPPDSSILYK